MGLVQTTLYHHHHDNNNNSNDRETPESRKCLAGREPVQTTVYDDISPN